MSLLTRCMIITVFVKSDCVKLRNFNFYSLNCDISQNIGCKKLNLTCIPAALTSRKNVTLTFMVEDQGHRAKALKLQTVSQTNGQNDPTKLILTCAPE